MEKKLRIQLFDEEGRLLSDRMVAQDSEISSGPKEPHPGPMRIEFTFYEQNDVEKVKFYIDQLVGTLPLGAKQDRKKKTLKLDDPNFREETLEQALTMEDQDALIAYLRTQGFQFEMSDSLMAMEFAKKLEIKERHLESYQWMIRVLRRAKNPKADRLDPMLIFGIKIYDDRERDEKVIVYLNAEYHKSYKIPVPEKPKEVFKKTTMLKFPHFMNDGERERFRREVRILEDNPEREPSGFFERWREYVENLPENLTA